MFFWKCSQHGISFYCKNKNSGFSWGSPSPERHPWALILNTASWGSGVSKAINEHQRYIIKISAILDYSVIWFMALVSGREATWIGHRVYTCLKNRCSEMAFIHVSNKGRIHCHWSSASEEREKGRPYQITVICLPIRPWPVNCFFLGRIYRPLNCWYPTIRSYFTSCFYNILEVEIS